ncbi:MAG: hypothetical protein K6G29_07790 [Clostridiales bacterium]|nr:hypothetical protein [Clostridiales bacterium]
MYTRQLNRKRRYSPPPGYVGTAFGAEPMEGKVHSPDPSLAPAVRAEVPEPAVPRESRPEPREDTSVLRDLLGDLRGRIGAEELILLLVMLLLATDGAGSEILLLALLLFAGGEEEA